MNKNIKFEMKLNLDKDFTSLMKASQRTGVPITLRGDRIVDFKINDGSNNVSHKYDMIVIKPAPTLLDLKLGEDFFSNVPFDKIKVTEDVLLLKTESHSDFNAILKIRFDKAKDNLKLSLIPKSNKIKDILNYELLKKNYNGAELQIKSSEEDRELLVTYFPSTEINKEYLTFLKKVDYVNDKLNLNISLNEKYVITNNDNESVDIICEFIKDKKIKPKNNIKIHFKVSVFDLKKILNNLNQGVLKHNYIINLLGKEINLGECELSMKESEILNKEEISDILKSNRNNEEKINIHLLIKKNEKLYFKF